MINSELTIVAYLLGGIIALILLINITGILFPPHRPPAPKSLHRTETLAAPKPMAPIQHNPVTAALDAELCKKYPLVDTAYKNGYRFVSYNPLVMELRE